MSYRKNDLVTIRIEDFSQNGEGIGKAEGYTLFVKDTVIGDLAEVKIMKAKKSYGFARLMNLIEPSVHRVEAACPVSRQCGGCQLQMLSYEEQLAYKEKKVKDDLERIGGFTDVPMEPIIGMEEPWRYRNKAQFPVGSSREGQPVAGFYAGRTHSIIPCEDCLIGVEENKVILEKVLEWMSANGIQPYNEKTGKGIVRHVFIRKGFATGEILVCLVVNAKKLSYAAELIESLKEVPGMTGLVMNINRERNNVILGKEMIPIWGNPYMEDMIGDVRYRISPHSFYQVNPIQTKKLYDTALEFAGLTGKETVWDLYCGIGTISLFLARQAKELFGVEIIPDAVRDAEKNAEINGITNVSFTAGRAEEVLPAYYAEKEKQGIKAHADVIVVDPPRRGCDQSLLETMVQMEPDRIVYVSCDPATLARDAKYLCENGYKLERVRPCDQFCHTVHVESVVLLSRTEGTTREG